MLQALPAYDEVFSPVDESDLAVEAAADVTDSVAASSEQSLDAGEAYVESSTDGPYANVATVSEPPTVSPSTEHGFVELKLRSPGEASVNSPPSGAASAHTPNSELSPHAQQMLQPTSDGGPSLARPIIIVRLADDQMEQLINETFGGRRGGASRRPRKWRSTSSTRNSGGATARIALSWATSLPCKEGTQPWIFHVSSSTTTKTSSAI